MIFPATPAILLTTVTEARRW